MEKLLAPAVQTDAEEDAKYGKGEGENDLPAELVGTAGEPVEEDRGSQGGVGARSAERAVAKKAAVEARLEERRKQEEERGE